MPKLTRLRIPTLILHGDYDFVPVICAAHIAEAISGSHFVILRNCGHFSFIEQPDAAYTVLSDLFQAT